MTQPNRPTPGLQPVAITAEQSKLLASALRLKIMHLLAETPRTAKQVAELLGKTPGNVHYHIQRLYEGQLLDLVETRTVGGIVEKYYRSKGTHFEPDRFLYSQFEPSMRIGTHLMLTEEDAKQFNLELHQLLTKWELAEPRGEEYAVEIIYGKMKQDPEPEEETNDES